MTKIIGLTGGIGSGKTTVANYFMKRSVPVYFADDEASKIRNLPETISAIKNTFGQAVFENEQLNTKKLADLVFSDKNLLAQLNAIIHPAVFKHFQKWLKLNESKPFVVREAAILFESGSDKDCDFVITVVAPESLRIERVMMRDSIGKEDVISRMKNQWNDALKIAKSDFIINNDNTQDLEMQVDQILKKLTI